MALKRKNSKEETADTNTDDKAAKMAAAQKKVADALAAGATAGEAAPEPEPKVETPETTEVVKSEPNVPAVAQAIKQIVPLYSHLENVLVAPYGAFPIIKFDNGECVDGDDTSFGKFIDVEVVSWNELRMVIGKHKDDPNNADVAYSYDGITVDYDGSSVAEQMETWKTDGKHGDVEMKLYRQVVGVLVNCDNATNVQNKMGDFVVVQLSPTSRTNFVGLQASAGYKLARGKIDEVGASTAKFVATPKKKGSRSWTSATCSLA